MPDVAPMTEAPATPEAPVVPDDAAILAQLGDQPAVPNQDGSTPVEKPKEKPPEPETPKESAVLRNVARREQELQRQRERDRSERQQWETSFEERLKRGIAEGVKAQLGGTDPRALIKQLNEAGLKDQAIADALLHKDAVTPEEMARLAREETAALRKERADEQARLTREANEAGYKSTAKAMADKGELPHLFDEWDEGELIGQTYALVTELRTECERTGRPMPQGNIDRQLLRLLDKRAKARQDARDGRRKAKGADDTGKAASQDATKAGANGSGHQGEKTGASATTTLGKGLGERPTVGATDGALLSDAEVLERAAASIARGEHFKART